MQIIYVHYFNHGSITVGSYRERYAFLVCHYNKEQAKRLAEYIELIRMAKGNIKNIVITKPEFITDSLVQKIIKLLNKKDYMNKQCYFYSEEVEVV